MKLSNDDIFHYEYEILEKAHNIIISENFKNNPLSSDFEELFLEYKKLISQSSGLVRISDKQQDYLYKLQSDLKNVLDNIGQGILTVNEELIINKGYSEECSTIFGNELEGQKLTELIRPFNSKESVDIIEAVLNSDFFGDRTDALQRRALLSLLPDEVLINNRAYRIQYSPIVFSFKNKTNSAFMIILTDITEKKEMKRAMECEKAIFKSITRIVSDIKSFSCCKNEFMNFYNNKLPIILEDNRMVVKDVVEEILREVHTAKGNLSIFELKVVVAYLDEVEQKLVTFRDNISQVNRDDILMYIKGLDFDSMLNESLNEIKNVIGSSWLLDTDFSIVDLKELKEIEKEAEKVSDSLYIKIHNLRLTDFCELLKLYPDYTYRMANRVEKQINPFTLECDEIIRVDPDKYENFTGSLVHIFRNIIDHGIETPEERIDTGKDSNGNISFKVSRKGNFINIVISDDGYGIDTVALKQKAIENNLIDKEKANNLSESEIADLMFLDGLSTANENNIYSGRGVGLAAVRYQTELLNGELNVKSKTGEGTTFEINIPFAG